MSAHLEDYDLMKHAGSLGKKAQDAWATPNREHRRWQEKMQKKLFKKFAKLGRKDLNDEDDGMSYA
jgi:hypothetical protein